MQTLKQSSAAKALVFYMVNSSDHVAPKTGLAPTVTLSKNGGSFAASSGAVSEMSGGFYKVAGHVSDTDTLGILALKAVATGADPVAMAYNVVAYDPDNATSLGLSRIDENVSAAKTLTSAERDAVSTVIEGHLLNEGDSQMLINAIVGAIGNQNVNQAALVAAIRSDLERGGGSLALLLLRATEARLAKLDVAGTLASSDTANTYKASGFATPADVSAARAAILEELPASPDNATLAAVAAEIVKIPRSGTTHKYLGNGASSVVTITDP